jgi:hypothetical protein
MELEQGRAFMAKQARAYAQRVEQGELNDSAVKNLLHADAEHAGDSVNAHRKLFNYGLGVYHGAIAVSA